MGKKARDDKAPKVSTVKYKEWVKNPHNLMLVEAWSRDGYKDFEIAEKIGISHKTLCAWKRDYPEFAKAFEVGREAVDYMVENALLKAALGYDYEEVETVLGYPDKNGNRKSRVTTVRKHQPGNVTAMLAWLNNRKPEQWKKNRDAMVTEEGDKQITVKIVKQKDKKSTKDDTDE